MVKKILLALVVISGGLLVWLALSWQSPGPNTAPKLTDAACVYSVKHQTAALVSMKQSFAIDYVQNAGADCINPGSPAIHIATKAKHNAWIQFVYTDTTDPKLQQYRQFVDSCYADSCKALWPFYNKGSTGFYDGPLWRWAFFSKPLSFWKAHAYAVEVDEVRKTIKCVGGIEWGFRVSNFHLQPKMIIPKPLAERDWNQDINVFKDNLGAYNALTIQPNF